MHLYTGSTSAFDNIYLNPETVFFEDVQVRQALYYALDRQTFVDNSGHQRLVAVVGPGGEQDQHGGRKEQRDQPHGVAEGRYVLDRGAKQVGEGAGQHAGKQAARKGSKGDNSHMDGEDIVAFFGTGRSRCRRYNTPDGEPA